MLNPKFSIIIPYGGEGNLTSTIDSALSQVLIHSEIIVVARKGMAQSVRSELVPEVSVFEEATFGVYGALNTGIDKANGELLCFLSSGAIYKSINVLAEYHQVFSEYPNAKFVTSGWIQNRVDHSPDIYLSKKLDSFKHFWGIQPMNIEAIAIRKNSDSDLRFDEKYLIAADYKFIRNLMNTGRAARLKIESVVLPPPGLSSNPQYDGESEVISIRTEMLAERIGTFAPKFNLVITSLLELPGLAGAWISLLVKKFKQAFPQSPGRD